MYSTDSKTFVLMIIIRQLTLVKQQKGDTMAQVFVALGTNQGDRLAQLRAALSALEGCITLAQVSSVYESQAAYVEDQPPFFNAVAVGTTTLPPLELLAQLKRIEQQLGRTPGRRFGPRPLDLDILLYDQLLLDTPTLSIPHPRMLERAFVLRPLAEIAPELRIPGTDAPVHALVDHAHIGAVLAIVAPPLWPPQ